MLTLQPHCKTILGLFEDLL